MNKFQIKTFIYNVDNILTRGHILLAINKFRDEELNGLNSDDKFSIIFIVKTVEGIWRSISTLQKEFDKRHLDDLADKFEKFWDDKSDTYHSIIISKIAFRYRLIEPEFISNKIIYDMPLGHEKIKTLMPEGSTNLPNNRLFETWGDISMLDANTYKIINGSTTYIVKQNDNEYNFTEYYKDNKFREFKDVYSSANSNIFVRTMGNSILHYEYGKCVFLKQSFKTHYIRPLMSDLSITNNIITMDLETRTIDEEMIPISVSIFDGEIVKSFYLEDFSNSDNLLKESIKYLLHRKYNGYRVYIHNFSEFDGVFLQKIMIKLDSCKVEKLIKRNGKIINLKLVYNLSGKRKYSIYFRDSLLMLPASLRKLGHSFNVDTKKTIYPYKFVNQKNINLNYVGEVPEFKFFNTINIQEIYKKFNGDVEEYENYKIDKNLIDIIDYKEYCKNFKTGSWSLREQTLHYCENDVLSLFSIIKEFQIMIFKLFEADINNYPTLSSLAFAIYRMKYIHNFKIPTIGGELYRNIRESYTGGSVDIYKPIGENVYRYDVNSLYPSVMFDFPSPVGNICKFKGDILKHKKDPFGFFYVNVSTPKNLHVPILQTRIKTTKGGIRTIAPLGKWSGWYFSEEILNAKKHGYKFDIIWGYTFDKQYIFKEYVNDLYQLKKDSTKNSSIYTICKLLLNALYGRFGMSPDKENCKVVKGSYEIGKFIHNKCIKITDITKIDEDIEIISYVKNKEFEEDGMTHESINVAIASSITSYARIKMSEIKTQYSTHIYYSDTDSVDLDIELPTKYVSNNLGDYKFENKFKNVVYIAPKVYAAITENGKEFIKVKGLKEPVNYNEIASVINERSKLVKLQEKWYKNIVKGRILTKIEDYTLMATENKRKLVYKNNKLVKSVPYKYIDGKLTN